MKLAKTTSSVKQRQADDPEKAIEIHSIKIDEIDKDLINLFLALHSRLRFGSGTSGDRGENISGEFLTFTTSATPDAENTTAHTVGSVPIGFIVLHQDKAGSLYQGPTTGTNWTASNIYTKCDVASVTFSIFLIK